MAQDQKQTPTMPEFVGDEMLARSTWADFADSGLFWWVNRGLHLFGWALVRVVEADGSISEVFPARCRFRGFDQETEEEGFRKLSDHLEANAQALAAQARE